MAKVNEITLKELAERLGLSTRRIQQLRAKGLPYRSCGRQITYEWDSVWPWFVNYKIAQELGKNGKQNEAERRARTRKLEAQAKLAELEAERVQGNLVDVDAFQMVLRDVAARLDGKLRSLPIRWAPDLLGYSELPTMVSRLDEVVEELRSELRTLSDE
jgi:phage terminase Nu1 subunit (DNA packaging protein)